VTIPFALLLGRWFGGIDVRHIGSGNVGAANVARSGGIALALAVTALDAGKGAAAVWFAGWLAPGPVAPAVAGVAAIVGHVRPVWLRFRGGKGVATTGGVFVVLAPLAVAASSSDGSVMGRRRLLVPAVVGLTLAAASCRWASACSSSRSRKAACGC